MKGACLFESLCRFSNRNHQELRETICDFLEEKPTLGEYKVGDDILKFEMGENLEEYIKEMRKLDTWGGAIEIQAFCELTGVKVVVLALESPTNKKRSAYEHLPKNWKNGTLFILYTGNHFEPIRYTSTD